MTYDDRDAGSPRLAATRSTSASIVVCTYTQERSPRLLGCVRAIQAQRAPGDEVIVVVDRNPRLAETLRPLLPPGTVVTNSDAGGLSAARNVGVRAATGDVVVFVDDDAVPEPGWLDELLGPFTDPDVAGVGGWVEPLWQHSPPTWWPDTFNWVVGCSYSGLPPDKGRLRNPIGASMAIRRRLIVAAGYFRTDIGRVGTLPLGCEETELAIRIAVLNPDVFFFHAKGAVVRHYVPSSRATPRYFFRRCWAEGVSKSRLARSVPRSQSLSTERSYLRHTLSRSVLGRKSGPGLHHFLQSAATMAGLLAFAIGYTISLAGRPAALPHLALRARCP